MKRLMYLFILVAIFTLTACGGSCNTDCTKECCAAEEAVVCPNTGEPCLDDHSCCVVKEDSVEHDHSDEEHSH